MDQTSKGVGPFSDILIDLGDSYDYTNEGYKFKFVPDGKTTSASFNAADAIFDVFGSGGEDEAPSTSSLTSQPDAFPIRPIDSAGPCGDSRPPAKPFVPPLLRTGGFEAVTPSSFGSGGDSSLGGGRRQFGGRNAPFGGGRPAQAGGFGQRGARGFQNHLGNSDRRQYNARPQWNGGGRFDGSGDKISPPATPTARLSSVNGFGRSNDDIALLSGRTRTGDKGSRSSNKKRNGNGRERIQRPATADHKQAVQEQPKETTEQQQQSFDAGAKRTKSFGENSQGMETAHKRPRLSCGICGRAGHSTEHCYSARNKDSLRCYNCNNMGHLAIRCPERGAGRGRGAPGNSGGGSRGGARPLGGQLLRAPNTARAGGGATTAEEKNQADDNNNKAGSGLGLICKLMQDTRMRKEAQRHTPKLYDDMLTFMLEHVQI